MKVRARSMLLAAIIVASVGIPSASRAAQPVYGPVDTAPGNPPDPTGVGASGAAGGLTWTYTGFDPNAYSALWWGIWNASSVQLAFDGAFDAPGETLQFSSGLSDLAHGVMMWTGSTTIKDFNGVPATVATRFTVHVTDGSGAPVALTDPTSVGASTVGGLAPVSGTFKTNWLFEALQGSTWIPAQTFYDAYPKSPSAAGQYVRNVHAGYFYVPPPSALSADPLLLNTTGPAPTLTMTAHLIASKTNSPIAGKTVTFTAGTTVVCTVTTNTAGTASCGSPQALVQGILALGYDVAFAGDADYLASGAHGGLVS